MICLASRGSSSVRSRLRTGLLHVYIVGAQRTTVLQLEPGLQMRGAGGQVEVLAATSGSQSD